MLQVTIALIEKPVKFTMSQLKTSCVLQDQGGAMLELRWLLELRMQRYIVAAGTLARVGNAEGGDAQTFATAKRAACLAKLALLADQEGGLAPVPPKASLHKYLLCADFSILSNVLVYDKGLDCLSRVYTGLYYTSKVHDQYIAEELAEWNKRNTAQI